MNRSIRKRQKDETNMICKSKEMIRNSVRRLQNLIAGPANGIGTVETKDRRTVNHILSIEDSRKLRVLS